MELRYTDKVFENNSIDIDEERDQNPWRDAIAVPAVGPEGQFVVDFYDRSLVKKQVEIQRGTTVTSYSKDVGISLTRWARERGWVLYEDMCAGDAKGIDGSPGHWKLWSSVAKLYAHDRTLRRGEFEKLAKEMGLASVYHPEVARRRSLQSDGGMLAMDARGAMEFLGFTVAEDTDDQQAKRGTKR